MAHLGMHTNKQADDQQGGLSWLAASCCWRFLVYWCVLHECSGVVAAYKDREFVDWQGAGPGVRLLCGKEWGLPQQARAKIGAGQAASRREVHGLCCM